MRRCSSLLLIFLVAQRIFGEVVVVLGVRRGGPHEVRPVDDLAHDVQVRRLLQVEHLAAHQHRGLGEAVHRQHPQNRVRLDADVVVHEQDLLAVGVFQRLVHHPAVAAGAAEVGLVVDGQPIAQPRGRGREVRVVAHLADALIGHDHRADHLVHQRIRGEVGQRVGAVRGAVERRDADGDVGGARRGRRSRTSHR